MKTFHEWQELQAEHSRGSKMVNGWFIEVESHREGVDVIYAGNVYDEKDQVQHTTRDFDEPWKAMKAAEQWAQENPLR